jgi:hypothetical protein
MARRQTPPVSVQITEPVCIWPVDFIPISLAHPECWQQQTICHPVTEPTATTPRAIALANTVISA